MKSRLVFGLVAVAVAVALSGCIPSVWPFYRPQDLVTDDRLAGEWQAKPDDADPRVWKFEKGEGKDYKLTVTDKEGKNGVFAARLFKLKQELFLDLQASDCDYASTQSGWVGITMYPGHFVVRVKQLAPNLQLALSDMDWLGKYFEEHPKGIAHHMDGEEGHQHAVLTAETDELQSFVVAHLGDGELFGKPFDLARKSAAADPAAKPGK
jgi:hypothetical protein